MITILFSFLWQNLRSAIDFFRNKKNSSNRVNDKRKVYIDDIPFWELIGANGIINYMKSHKIDTVMCRFGVGMEYSIEDIEESYDFILKKYFKLFES